MNILGFEKILYHNEKLTEIKKGIPQYPVHATISLSNFCNERCLWCTVAKYQEGEKYAISSSALLDYLEYAQSLGLKALTYVGKGEPLTHAEFSNIARRSYALGLEQGLFTNGFLLDRHQEDILETFAWVRVSLDAARRETHDRLHGCKGHFDRIVDSIRSITKVRKENAPKVGIQFAVHQENIHELVPAAKLAQDLGADYFSVKPVFSRGAVGQRIAPNCLGENDVYPLVLEAKQVVQDGELDIYYRRFQFESHSKEKNVLPYGKCVAGAFNINVSERGQLTICGPNEVVVGSIDELGDGIKEKIHCSMSGLDLLKCPAGCRYHALNHLVAQVLDPKGGRDMHANFI